MIQNNYQNILNEINHLKELKKKLLNKDNKYVNDQCNILDNKISELENQLYLSEIDKNVDNIELLKNTNFQKKKEINLILEENKKLDIKIEELNIINKDKLKKIEEYKLELKKNQIILDITISNNNQLLLQIEDEKSKVFSNFNIIDIKNKKIDKLKLLIIDEENIKYNYLEKLNTYFETNKRLLNEIDLLNIKLDEYKNTYSKIKSKNKELINLKKKYHLESNNLNDDKNVLLIDTKNILDKLEYIDNKYNKVINYFNILDNKNIVIKENLDNLNIDLETNETYKNYINNQNKYNELHLLFIKYNNQLEKYDQINLLNEYYNTKINEYINLKLFEKIKENELLIHEVIKIKEKNKLFFEKLESIINNITKFDNNITTFIKTLENRLLIGNNNNYNYNNNFMNYMEKIIIDNTIISNNNNISNSYISNDYTLFYMLINNGMNAILFNDYVRNIKNKVFGINIDIEFYKMANYFDFSEQNIFKHILNFGVIEGYLYSAKQFYKLFSHCNLINNNINNQNILYVNDNENSRLIDLKSFLANNLYNKDFNYFINKFEILDISLNICLDLSLFVFIGYRERGIDLINKINNYILLQDYNCIIILNDKNNYDLVEKINCKNRIVYLTDDYGNDIIPTLIAYNDVKNKIQLNYIIKLQTKYNIQFFNNNTDYLLNKKLNELIILLENNNCIGNPNYYSSIKIDKFYNSLLIIKYQNYININKYFVAGTMFFCHKVVFDKIIDFIKNNNYRSYFINNLYDTNSVNKLASPVHFLERLFGLIK
ncbi:hypothetical protein [Chlorella virus XW01]|nr:hypothetical protein [Chlorella virus XW01]